MKFFKTAWKLLDKEGKLLSVICLLGFCSIISTFINEVLYTIFVMIMLLFIGILFYRMLKEDIIEFIKKVKKKMREEE
ncbi:MAG: hypothetical protein KHZ90_08190 [Veillonella parvula]|uniref:Uncharacterized protein n=1 Tax=Veillonella parvula TaxID=29466 RepID=A0A943A454_VEIPA|nr:hypothetical protein [Veillonella parvula]MBS4893739.1 hypothetical protein [Veillonella parvula]